MIVCPKCGMSCRRVGHDMFQRYEIGPEVEAAHCPLCGSVNLILREIADYPINGNKAMTGNYGPDTVRVICVACNYDTTGSFTCEADGGVWTVRPRNA